MRTRTPGIMDEYRRKLEDKVKELLEGSAVDEGQDRNGGYDFCRQDLCG